MLDIIFASESIVDYQGKNEIVIRINSNFHIRIVSKKGVGYEIHFAKVRVNGEFYYEGKIAEVRTLQKVRALILEFKTKGKDRALSLAMRYNDPIQLISRIIDPYGFLVKSEEGRGNINALRESEVLDLQRQGYTIIKSNTDQHSNAMSMRIKTAKRVMQSTMDKKR